MSNYERQDPALISQQSLATMAFLEPVAIEWMLICLGQDQAIFEEARSLIAPHHFRPEEGPLRLIYEAMISCYDRHGGISYQNMAETANTLLRDNEAIYVMNPDQRDILFREDEHGLIQQVCNPGFEINAVQKNHARDILKRYANERTVVEPLRTVMNPGRNEGVPANLEDFLTIIATQQARLSTLHELPLVDMAPEEGSLLLPSNVFLKTGVDFIDGPLGGTRVGDCNGLLGPTGGGKTTFGVHLVCRTAKQCYGEFQAAGGIGDPSVAVYITAEEAGIRLRPRFWSNFFQIKRDRLDKLTDWSELSQPSMLEPYEIEFQKGQEYKLSEIERYRAYSDQLRRSLITIDMSGSEAHPNAGNGHVPEMVSYLDRLQRDIRVVVIDYAGLICTRFMHAQGYDENSYRRLLKNFGDECRVQIAERFGCTVWVMHQLKGSTGTSSPTRLIHHSEGAESKDFADNMAVCGCLGTEEKSTGLRACNWSKIRYLPGVAVPPSILRINKFAMFEEVSNFYQIDTSSRQFISAQEATRVQGEDLQRRAAMTGPVGMRDATNLDSGQRADW